MDQAGRSFESAHLDRLCTMAPRLLSLLAQDNEGTTILKIRLDHQTQSRQDVYTHLVSRIHCLWFGHGGR